MAELGTLAQVGLALASLAVLGGLGWAVARSMRSARQEERERVARVERGFVEFARRRGLQLHRFDPITDAGRMVVPIAPSVRGTIDGFAIGLSIEPEPRSQDDVRAVLRVTSRAGSPEWPTLPSACARSDRVPDGARAALERLCAASRHVELERRMIIAAPSVEAETDALGRTARVASDPEQLDAWLQRALELARALS